MTCTAQLLEVGICFLSKRQLLKADVLPLSWAASLKTLKYQSGLFVPEFKKLDESSSSAQNIFSNISWVKVGLDISLFITPWLLSDVVCPTSGSKGRKAQNPPSKRSWDVSSPLLSDSLKFVLEIIMFKCPESLNTSDSVQTSRTSSYVSLLCPRSFLFRRPLRDVYLSKESRPYWCFYFAPAQNNLKRTLEYWMTQWALSTFRYLQISQYSQVALKSFIQMMQYSTHAG